MLDAASGDSGWDFCFLALLAALLLPSALPGKSKTQPPGWWGIALRRPVLAQ